MQGYYAIECRQNHELTVIDELNEQFGDGIKVVCPMIVEQRKPKRRRSRKLIEVTLPRFKGYLFAHFSDGAEWQRVLHSRLVWGVLSCDGIPYEIPAPVIEDFPSVVDMIETNSLFKIGDEIILTEGPFSGFSGRYAAGGVIEIELFGRMSVINASVNSYEKRYRA